MGLGLAAVEGVFASLHNIRDDKRVAFRARLKHLQRLGFPPGVNTGTGKRAEYHGQQIFLLGLALEMLQLGLTPERATHVIQRNYTPICACARLALFGLNKDGAEAPSMFVRFDPAALDALGASNGHDEADTTFWYEGVGTLADMLRKGGTLWPRVALINLSSLISHVFTLIHEFSSASADAFENELTTWLDSHPEDEQDGNP